MDKEFSIILLVHQRGLKTKIARKPGVFQKFRHFLLFKNSLRLTFKLVFFSFPRLK
ncbi:hypothetical Protein pso3_06200 [Candidatus Phytoplasma solani]